MINFYRGKYKIWFWMSSQNFSLSYKLVLLVPWRKLILNQNEIIALFQNLNSTLVFFFFHMGLRLALWTTTFSTEESETEFKLLMGKKIKLHLHTSITVNITVIHYFLQDFSLYMILKWSWKLSSFKCWHRLLRTSNQKLNLKRFKKKIKSTNSRS